MHKIIGRLSYGAFLVCALALAREARYAVAALFERQRDLLAGR